MTDIIYLTKIILTIACIASVFQDLKDCVNFFFKDFIKFKVYRNFELVSNYIKVISSQIYSVILVIIMYKFDISEYELVCLLAMTIALTVLHKTFLRPSYDSTVTMPHELRICIVSIAITSLLWLSPMLVDPRLELFTRVIVVSVLTAFVILDYIKGHTTEEGEFYRSWDKRQIVFILFIILLGHSSTDAFIRILMLVNAFNGVLGLQQIYKKRILDNLLVQNIALLALFIFS